VPLIRRFMFTAITSSAIPRRSESREPIQLVTNQQVGVDVVQLRLS